MTAEKRIASKAAAAQSSKLRACPYCKRPVEADGSIYHAFPCAGLDRVDINRLQYDALVAAARRGHETNSASSTAPHGVGPEPADSSVGTTPAPNCMGCAAGHPLDPDGFHRNPKDVLTLCQNLPFADYEVTCTRCGKVGKASEEGDEWECPPCWERCEAQERAAEKASARQIVQVPTDENGLGHAAGCPESEASRGGPQR